MNNETVESAQVASDAAFLAQKAVGVADSRQSALSRLGEAAAAVATGARLAPAATRMFRRHPLASLLFLMGLAYVAHRLRPPTQRGTAAAR